MSRKWLLLCLAAVGILAFALWRYYKPYLLHEAISPDGQWIAQVWAQKSSEHLEVVFVDLYIQDKDGKHPWKTRLESPDLWSDIKKGACEILWISPTAMKIRDSSGDEYVYEVQNHGNPDVWKSRILHD